MAISCFTDKLIQPTESDLELAMGAAFPLWQRLVGFIARTYQIEGEMSYGGKNYGWNLWVRKSGKALAQTGKLVAQVVLGREQVEQALGLDLSETVGGMVRETPQLHDGKWLFIPVSTDAEARDIEQLLLVKKRAVRRKQA